MSYQYPNQPGYPPPYPPRKSNTGLIVGLVVVIVGAVVALVLVLLLRGGDKSSSGQTLPGGGSTSGSDSGTGGGSAGDSTGSAKALGQKVVQVIQNHAMEEAQRLVCTPDSKFLRSMRGVEGVKMTVTLNDVTESGDTAVAAVTMVRDEDKKSADQKINMKKADGKWCIN